MRQGHQQTMEWKPTRQSVNIFKVISSFLGHYWKRECENLLTWNFAPVSELLFSKTKNNKYGRNMVKVVSVTLNLVLLPQFMCLNTMANHKQNFVDDQ